MLRRGVALLPEGRAGSSSLREGKSGDGCTSESALTKSAQVVALRGLFLIPGGQGHGACMLVLEQAWGVGRAPAAPDGENAAPACYSFLSLSQLGVRGPGRGFRPQGTAGLTQATCLWLDILCVQMEHLSCVIFKVIMWKM